MKLEKPINPNYCATVVSINNIIPLDNCDNVVATNIFGFQAIVSKEVKLGDIWIVFPAETQLSEEYCYENNLFRHDDKNKTLGVKGYIEDSRRVKAVKFRNNRSDCLFMSLGSLSYLGVKDGDLKVGDEFDTINGKQICIKYTLQRGNPRVQQLSKKLSRVDSKFMPEHYDTDNFFKWGNTIPSGTGIVVTQKLNGTSIRIANTQVNRKLNLFEKLLDKLGVKIQKTEFDYVYGSRKVIKDINNPNQNHYYEKDIWTSEGQNLIGLIPQGYIVYAELVGWTDTEAPIQKGYTYGFPKGRAGLYVYRVAHVNGEGLVQDLSWSHLVEFCKQTGINHVVEVWRGRIDDFKVNDWMNHRYFYEGNLNCVPLDFNDTVDEGVCIRVDSRIPKFFKAKSSKFLEHETKLLDEQAVDIEADQSINEDTV